MPESDDAPKVTLLGKLFILLVLAGCGWAAWRFLAPALGAAKPATTTTSGGTATPPPVASGDQVRITLAYGTEKERWLKWAVEELAKSEPGIAITLVPKGTIEAAQALNAGERYHIWAPASSLYAPTFAADWQLKQGKAPFARTETLALTPMVFVWWQERFAALKQPPNNFRDLAKLLAEPTGWAGLAGKSEWGFLKFGHTHPNQSNSGLMALLLMTHDYHQTRTLTMGQVLDAGFQGWLTTLEKGITGLPASTGSMMKDMVLKGPSAYDGVCVYESVAIDFLANAQGRWGDLRITYPTPNIWSDNPAYILDATWSDPAQRAAAGKVLDFLMSAPAQQRALTHGFRPGDPAVPVRAPGSPFSEFERYGLKVEVPTMVETPSPEVVQNLLVGWQRSVGR